MTNQIALLVDGRSEGLSALAGSVCDEINAARRRAQQQQQQDQTDGSQAEQQQQQQQQGGAVTVLMVRNLIQELAVRKAYGLKDGTLQCPLDSKGRSPLAAQRACGPPAATPSCKCATRYPKQNTPHPSAPQRPPNPAATLANLDATEDESPEHCWCWEARDLRAVPKAARALADAHRKHRKALQDHMRAAGAFAEAAALNGGSKAIESKVARAAAKLRKLPDLGALREQLRAALAAAAAGGSKQQGKTAAAAAAAPATPAAAADVVMADAPEGGAAFQQAAAAAATTPVRAAAAGPQGAAAAATASTPAPTQPSASQAATTADKSAAKAAKEAERAR